MNKEIKKFYSNRKKEDFCFEDIQNADFGLIPNDKQGVYILVAKKGKFLYPSKKYSPIFYIGMSTNLKKRLKSHQNEIKRIHKMPFKDRWDDWYWERHQYAVAFECRVLVFTIRSSQSAKNLEANIIENFYNEFYGKPVANGAFSFKKINTNY